MANEAVKIELGQLGGKVVRFTVADGIAISGNTVCRLIDPVTVSGNAIFGNLGVKVAGIAATDKEAGDGSTTLGLYTDGIFDMVSTGSIDAGEMVTVSGNTVMRSAFAGDFASGAIIGKALETSTNGEVIAVKLIGL